MERNVLITGGSGYLGGSLLQRLKDASTLPSHIYALVRNDDQAKQVMSHYSATPMTLDLEDENGITRALRERQISVVFFLIDAFKADTQIRFIKALGAVGRELGTNTHFLHTSGAKIFSSLVGMPHGPPLSDADPKMYDLQKSAQAELPLMQSPVNANNEVIEASEAHGVKSYIFIPCIVYGKGTGFGNPISIQTVAIVKAAKALRRVHKADGLNGTWPVSHVDDTVTLYQAMLSKILGGEDISCNKNGYYLAASGNVSWAEIYQAMSMSLAARGVVDDASVGEPSDEALEQMAKALDCGKEFVPVQMGGNCTLQADQGSKIGWTPKYDARHIIRAADDEVELILNNI